jgi:hypothetical protein
LRGGGEAGGSFVRWIGLCCGPHISQDLPAYDCQATCKRHEGWCGQSALGPL